MLVLEAGQIVWRFPPTLCISRSGSFVWEFPGTVQESLVVTEFLLARINSNITLTAWLLLFNALNFHNSLVPGSKSDQQITQGGVNGWSLQKLILALERNGARRAVLSRRCVTVAYLRHHLSEDWYSLSWPSNCAEYKWFLYPDCVHGRDSFSILAD